MKTPSRKQAALISMLTHYSTTIFLIVQGIVLVPWYIQFLGQDLYGGWLATGSIVGYLGLLDLGLGSVIGQQAASTAGLGDRSRLGAVITTGLLVSAAAALAVVAAGWLLHPYVAGWVGIADAAAPLLNRAFFLAVLSTGAMMIACAIGGVFLGIQRPGMIGIQYIFATVAGVAVTVVMLFRGGSVLSIAAGMLARSALVVLGHCGYLLWWLTRPGSPRLGIDGPVIRALMRQSLWVCASRLAGTAVRRSDALIVAALAGPAQTAVLTITQKAADILRIFIDRAISATTPGLAHLYGELAGHHRVRVRTAQIVRLVLWAAALGVGGYCLFNREFIRLWLGTDPKVSLFGGLTLTALIGMTVLIMTVNNLLYAILFAAGKVELTARVTLIEAAIRLPLTLLFCYQWGIAGVVAAGALSLLITGIALQTTAVCRTLHLPIRPAVAAALMLLVRALIPAALFVLAGCFWRPRGLLPFGLGLAAYLLVGLCWMLVCEKPFATGALRIFTRLTGRGRKCRNALECAT